MQDRYRVVAGPPMSPPDVSVESLETLASALNTLGQPATAALDQLTADMIELAFNSLRPKERQALLGMLGIRMAAPRRAGNALCRDVLGRLRREARQHNCVCGVQALTGTVMIDVGTAAFPEADVLDPVAKWGRTLVLTAMFAWCQASVADARVLVWAADQNWLGAVTELGVDEQGLAAVHSVARAVVEAHPDMPSSNHEQPEPEEAATATTPTQDVAVPDVPTQQWAGQEGVTEPEEACRRLTTAMAEAAGAAQRVSATIGDGRPPADDDLTPLTGLRNVFEDARSVFAAAGVTTVPLRLEDMARAADSLREAHGRDRAAREALRELLSIGCTPDSPALAAAEAVRDYARRLLGSPEWGETERRESSALAALAELVRLGRQADAAAEILALQTKVVRVLPACATAVVMANELTLSDRAEEARTGAPDTGPEEPDVPRSDLGGDDVRTGGPRAGEHPEGATAVAPPAEDGKPDDEDSAAAPTGAYESLDLRTHEHAADDATESAADGAEPQSREEPAAAVLDEATPTSSRPVGTGVDRARSASPAEGPAAIAGVPGDGERRFAPVTGAVASHGDGGRQRTDTTTTDTEDVPDNARAATEQALARLVTERRFGLAHHLARAAGRPEREVTALRLAGAAALLTSGTGPGARLVADLLGQQSSAAGRDFEGNELVLLPALLRTALVTGDHVAGAQLKAMVPRLPDALGEVTAAVADRALSGALMIASPLVVIADVSETEARLRELREQSIALTAHPRLRFARATEIAKRWLADDGLLGSMLRAVITDDRDALSDIRDKAERLSKLSEVNAEIDRMDRKLRSSSGKPLQGSGRQDLVHAVERSVALVKEWCLTVDRVRGSERSDTHRATKEISALRQLVLGHRATVVRELEKLAKRSGTVAAAAAWAAHSSMEELFDLLSGDARPAGTDHGALEPELVLDAELLKVCDTLTERPPLDRLLTAVDRGWDEALNERLDHDAFGAARSIMKLADQQALPGRDGAVPDVRTRADIDDRETGRRTALALEHADLMAEVHRAQADGAVTDDQDLRLQELLADARARLDTPEGNDLTDVRRALRTVRADLPAYRQEATARIRARLDALDLTNEERAQVLRHLDTGGLATAADLVYFLEIGEPVPEIEAGESHLTEFFPVVPEGLPKGIDQELVDLVRSGGEHPAIGVLDYRTLSSDEAALAADALSDWRALGATEQKDRGNISRFRLLPALKLLGYDAKSGRWLDELSQQRREYRFFEATGVEVNGRAKVPAFGSQIKEQGGTLRVLMVWGRPPAKVVMSLAGRDPSGTSLLVFYFGTLGPTARAELAAGSDRLQSMLVVDDAALAYLAARGNRQVSTATQTLLPFSGVNPYIREKRGRIGREMFYGRDAERQSILDPRGTQVIFGGRGLGKSALLSDAGERFMEQRTGFQQYVYINLDQENIGKGSSLGPEALWSVLDRELTEIQVLGRQGGRKSPNGERSERVRAGIRSWLDGDSRRRLLILLDECDQFFEADAPRFDQTKKLKGLGSDTKDRAKVVFAGLHSVQRFSKLASNGPFGHLAQTPKVIGPLAPQFAADLLVEPMRALGFEFEDVDLVNRVLGFCSYQPFLLQMFGHRLVEVMHRQRARRGVEGPPFTVAVADIETVESDTALRTGISAAFKDTLSLDHRYDVIANVLAYHARHRGLEVRLSDAELREECETWWRKGFEQLDTEGFRAYLSEMVGLGILAPNHDGQGWHLRGPNALRMIGTSHEVEARLLRAEQDCKLEESIVLEGRPDLPDRRSAPLTITQLDDLLGERTNQTRVVLGTPATGVMDVGDALRTVTERIDGWTLPPIGRPSVFKQELVGGQPRERRVIISDFARYPVKPDTCRDAVELANTLLPTVPGVTRAVVLVTDTRQLDLWRVLLTSGQQVAAAPVVLRRHDRHSLRGWAQRLGEVFHTEERLERLYAVTSGWPWLVDRVHRLHTDTGDTDQVLRSMAGLVTDRAAARAFAEATGVHSDPALTAGYRAVEKQFQGAPADVEDVVTAIAYESGGDEDEARWVFACLDALQVFDREEGGRLRLEPLLRQCLSPGMS
ncbi:hypothetical protein [Streptomyces hirsutus]|uniref:hypothetical protein n=1 Tax=Streptomyces hirsutus TaxID=35620 RepID=UPI003665A8DA